MKNLSLLAFLILIFITSNSKVSSTETSAATPKKVHWDLVWQDEFDKEGAPDSTKWGYDVGGHGWGNNESQFYTVSRLENARVEKGKLIIEARKESYNGANYTSARLMSKHKGDFKYGRIVVRAKVPKGRGTWAAIWMLPTDWAYGNWPSSGEIDIMEHVGCTQNEIHGTVHTGAFNHLKGTQKGNSTIITDATTNFHDYIIEWDELKINFFIDGELYFTFDNKGQGPSEWPFDQRFHIILNIAIGGSWGGMNGIDNAIFPQKMEIDYVRVYQNLKIQNQIVN
ncbi:MAG: glycoside hydrolase family 16 protein [Oligoflexia bacterium]|nr:glycoside hydrolase family 16 protein [Oligoflexia bacterium]